MNSNELNQYIKHYIEKDHTDRAILLTGKWGMGKSYYIQNNLVPFLKKEENGNHDCVIVSLYGLSNLNDLSRAIFFESRIKKIKKHQKAVNIVALTGKTIIKGIGSIAGIDLGIKEEDLIKIYQSIDLSNQLIIVEDIERTNINIFELLGFINNLTEQEHVKVMLVANEEEIIKYRNTENTNGSVEMAQDWLVESIKTNNISDKLIYTKETEKYLAIKEKTIGDTIRFEGDTPLAIKQIINSFENPALLKYSTEQDVFEISRIMNQEKKTNLRSFIYACQKTADIYEIIGDSQWSDDFLRAVFYSVVSFSLKLNDGGSTKWIGVGQYSQELGENRYPLFRFCYDYITKQTINNSSVKESFELFKRMRLYDREKSLKDPDLNKLYEYYIHEEKEIVETIQRVTVRLKVPENISFYDYPKIALSLIRIHQLLNINIEDAKDALVNNLRGRGKELSADDLFWYVREEGLREEKDEFIELRNKMIESLNENAELIPMFDYLPEQAFYLNEYVSKNLDVFYDIRGFAKYLDMTRVVEMFNKSSAKEMDDIRGTFLTVYRPQNIKGFLSEDLTAIENLIQLLNKNLNSISVDSKLAINLQLVATLLQVC